MAAEAKWTPGPWAVWPMGRVLAITCTGRTKPHPSEGMHVACVHMPEHNTQHDELWKANASLMAAAPDLYEALQRLEQFGHTDATWDYALRAMAKARGEA